MRRSFKQQILQKSNHLLLNNHLQESTHTLSNELSDELNVDVANSRINSKHLLHRIKH
ncbi:MAG: hypothetical protein WDZ91_08465 [Paenibacillaceae bacterium]